MSWRPAGSSRLRSRTAESASDRGGTNKEHGGHGGSATVSVVHDGPAPLVEIERAVQARAKDVALDVAGVQGDAQLRALIEHEVERWDDEYRRGLRSFALPSPQLVAERVFRNL